MKYIKIIRKVIMRTNTSRQAEVMTFEKFGTASLIIGTNKVLLNRHIIKPLKRFYVTHTSEIHCSVIAFVFGIILGGRL